MTRTLERKVQAAFVDRGFGFPVVLVDVPMVRVRGEWTPDLDYEKLAHRLLLTLVHRPVRLTGNQVRFIRQSLSMTLEQFARRFGVTHPAVLKWERAGNRPTVMAWAIEKDIRLEVMRSASAAAPKGFLKTYRALQEEPPARPLSIRLKVA